MSSAQATGVIAAEFEPQVHRIGRWRRLGLILRDNPLGFFGLVVIFILAVFALFAPIIAPYDPERFVGAGTADPSLDHFFGTDKLGRDMFSRVVFGARISLMIGFGAVIFGTVVGTLLGIFSGYVGGWIDGIIMRGVDTLIAFPALLLLLIMRQVLGPSLQTLIIAIALAIIPRLSRVVRGAVLSERNNQYVEAARALGASTPRILLVHIAPNIIALAIIVMTTLLGTAILAEASLSFLGLGVPDTVTWGKDVSDARNSFPVHIWWAFFPGAAITLTVLGFNLLGDSLRDIFDPRLRGRL
jgi:ABC-type dipeptide/oligopeptide/nickel transport system permease subunit